MNMQPALISAVAKAGNQRRTIICGQLNPALPACQRMASHDCRAAALETHFFLHADKGSDTVKSGLTIRNP
jgi:hypothetical protein